MQNRKLDRAKLFLSFDSLKGYREIIKSKERVVISRKQLSEDDLYELDWKIHTIKKGMLISIVYYDYNEYISLEGVLVNINLEKKLLQIVDKIIDIDKIVSIAIEKETIE